MENLTEYTSVNNPDSLKYVKVVDSSNLQKTLESYELQGFEAVNIVPLKEGFLVSFKKRGTLLHD